MIVLSPTTINNNGSFGFINTKIAQMAIGEGLSFKATITLSKFPVS
jgi:hypothetical protein